MCHCSDTGLERIPNNSLHTKLTLEKKILPPLLPGFELATFRSQIRHSNQQAIVWAITYVLRFWVLFFHACVRFISLQVFSSSSSSRKLRSGSCGYSSSSISSSSSCSSKAKVVVAIPVQRHEDV